MTSRGGAAATWRTRVRGLLPRGLGYVVPVRVPEPAEVLRRRRRTVAAVSAAGAGLLGVSLSRKPDSPQFYGLSLATAVTWTVGAVASGPVHRGWIETQDQALRRPVVVPVLTGVGAFGCFYAAALVAQRIPVLDAALRRVLRFADGSTPLVALTTLANGAAEELFFRGALYDAVGESHPVLVSTVAYTATTASSRNPSLILAGAVMGTLFGLQRRATGGIQASTLTHLTWSALMLRFLPPLFREPCDVPVRSRTVL
ncbi:CPBP family intramembrane glutamic endopeptidase [Mumia zhuanghuii]|uniref:CPBP family intramembrane glutamic endopeptidase n=1 Tax=Mumia zhuanghuii TaxID=2585211 RepID=UPI001E491911|nr:CPBP family intramembrane glutamic endopeptidase [Mumia zhuanghuii]